MVESASRSIANLQVALPKFERKMTNGKEVVFFQLAVCCGRKKWRLEKRFNEFYDFDGSVRPQHGNMPSLPAKTWMPLRLDKDIEDRRAGLEEYMLTVAARADMRCNSHFRAFLNIEKHLEESVVYTPVKVAELLDLPMGVRDLDLLWKDDEGV